MPGGSARWRPVPPRRYAPVEVSSSRVIRTVVGLRPFRPSGFVLRVDKLDDKVLIHNYGHGGGGVTLSWGTAHMAMEEALQTEHSRCAVIGCGAVGLATARLMQRRGWEVTIYAEHLPPQTTSNAAAAQWSPSMVFERGQTTSEFDRQFVRAARLAHRRFQDLVGDRYGIRWIENCIVGDQPLRQPAFRSGLETLYPAAVELAPDEHPFPGRYARKFTTMLIEMPIYLGAMMNDVLWEGGRIISRRFDRARELSSLSQPVIFNCTGLGASSLFADDELTPVKGQLTVLLPQPEIDYILIKNDLYMMPRHDGILLGGTRERGVWTLEPNREAAQRIMAGHSRLFGGEGADIGGSAARRQSPAGVGMLARV